MGLPDSVLVGILISLTGLVNSGTQPVAGALADRFGHWKAWVQTGLVLMAVCTVGFLWVDSFLGLVVLRSLQGLAFAITLPATLAILKTVTVRRLRGGAMGVFTTFRMIGFSIGPLLGGVLHVHYGFGAVFWTGAGLLALGALAVQRWVDEPEKATFEPPAFKIFDPELREPGLIALGIGTFVMASTLVMMSALENEFNARLDQTALGFGVAFSALTVTRVLFQVPLGRLSDRIGRKSLVIGGLLLLAPSTVALGLVQTTVQLTLVRLIQGLATASIAAPSFALAGDLARAGGEGRQMSVLTIGFALGLAIGPLVAGVLAVVGFEIPFVVGGAMSLLAAWVVGRWVTETVNRKEAAGEGSD
jgi:MFS family permease